MIHIVGITPEAQTVEDAFGGEIPPDVERIPIGKADLRALFHGINQTENRDIDVAVVGCPFLTLEEFVELAELLDGRTVKKRLWLYTDYIEYSAAKKAGLTDCPWGPFGQMDINGLDITYQVEMSYYHESGEERDRPPEALKEMVDRGDLGVKSGKGFYSYPDPEFANPDFLKG